MTIEQTLLETSKKLNAALKAKKYKKAKILLNLSNDLRKELGMPMLTLPTLQSRN
jgi:hypothetical protein